MLLDKGLTVLSYGGGQDSTAILYKIMYDPDFRAKFVKGYLLVVMADTGNEHPPTYDHVQYTEKLCKENKIPFIFLTSDKGYHLRTWPNLKHQYKLNNTCGSKNGFRKSCTGNLKIKVIYKYLEHYLDVIGGYPGKKKKGMIEYAKNHGKITVILGIAKGEEKRVAKATDKTPPWMLKSIEKVYPLIDIGYGRKECQDFIKSTGHPVPLPSNCMICHFLHKIELLYLYRFHRDEFEEWVEIEMNKITRFMDLGDKNYGVFGKLLLPEVLKQADEEYGHMTDQELIDYKMSHGHCVTNAY